METYTYAHYSWTRNQCIESIMVLEEALSDADNIRDFIVQPNEITDLAYDGDVTIDSPLVLAEYFIGQ